MKITLQDDQATKLKLLGFLSRDDVVKQRRSSRKFIRILFIIVIILIVTEVILSIMAGLTHKVVLTLIIIIVLALMMLLTLAMSIARSREDYLIIVLTISDNDIVPSREDPCYCCEGDCDGCNDNPDNAEEQ